MAGNSWDAFGEAEKSFRKAMQHFDQAFQQMRQAFEAPNHETPVPGGRSAVRIHVDINGSHSGVQMYQDESGKWHVSTDQSDDKGNAGNA